MPQKKKGTFIMDVLVEGPGGELIFKPVEVSPDDISQLKQLSQNPVAKFNIKKELKRKKGGKKLIEQLEQA
jgi:hypothetical protein